MELATEKACGWLSANIAGESSYPELGLLTYKLYFSEIRGRIYSSVIKYLVLLIFLLVGSMQLLCPSLFRNKRNDF